MLSTSNVTICVADRSLSSAPLDHCSVDLWLEQGANIHMISSFKVQKSFSSCILRGSNTGIRHLVALAPSCSQPSSNATRQNQHG